MTTSDKDEPAMESTSTALPTVAAPTITSEAFFVERQKFWFAWSNFVLACVISIAAILILLALFLL
jgi:hypothetical protein